MASRLTRKPYYGLAELCERWGIQPGQTTADGELTLELAECLGACDGAPCMLINDELSLCVTADDVAETMLNLIQSNRFVTGEIIVIDGGFTSST